jgi:hypothetical protein
VGGKMRKSKKLLTVRLFFYGFLSLFLVGFGLDMLSMPGESFKGELAPFPKETKKLASTLKSHVKHLSHIIGERNVLTPRYLNETADWVFAQFESMGYKPGNQWFEVKNRRGYETKTKLKTLKVRNIIVEIKGIKYPDEIVILGAHYDSVIGSPGANDNASAMAALLELARGFKSKPVERTIRFVAFVNEEPPFFKTSEMGSLEYAKYCHKNKDNVVSMIALDMLGCYSSEVEQEYPWPLGYFFPESPDFIGFVGNYDSKDLVRNSIGVFRESTKFPSEGIAGPEMVKALGFSDHWSFWQYGYKGMMITDTAFFRYEHYHEQSDTYEKLEYEKMAVVVQGVERVLDKLVGGKL